MIMLRYNNFTDTKKQFSEEYKNMDKIVLKLDVELIEDTARVTSMFCFKNCSVNQN